MQTSSLIQVLVFVLAAVIVLVFVASGIHFIRAVYRLQETAERERRARAIAAHIAVRLQEQQAVELKQRDGVLVQQPDGARDVALCVESTAALPEADAACDGSAADACALAAGGPLPPPGHSGWAAGLPPELLEPPRRQGFLAGLREFVAAMNAQGFRR